MSDIKRRSLFGLLAFLVPAAKAVATEIKTPAIFSEEAILESRGFLRIDPCTSSPLCCSPLLNKPASILPGHITYYHGCTIRVLEDFAEIDRAIADG